MDPVALIASGYRRVSNRYRLVARIDRPDWIDILARDLLRSPAEFYVPGAKEPAGMWADHYRRCFSRDTLTLDPDVFYQIPTSCHDPVGFVPPSTKSNIP